MFHKEVPADLHRCTGPKEIKEIAGPFDVDPDTINNQTARDVYCYIRSSGRPVSIVEHPKETITCAEKAELFIAHPAYQSYGQLRIARGALLTWKSDQNQKFMLHMSDSEARIDFKSLKEHLGLGKKQDLTFFKGDVEAVIGLEHGGVSVLVTNQTHLNKIHFDQSLVVGGQAHPGCRWDFAFSRKHSMLVEPQALIECLREHQAFLGKLDVYTPGLPQYKG